MGSSASNIAICLSTLFRVEERRTFKTVERFFDYFIDTLGVNNTPIYKFVQGGLLDTESCEVDDRYTFLT